MRRFFYTLLGTIGIATVTILLASALMGSLLAAGMFVKQHRARRVYHLTVVHGSGSGDYGAGVPVPIKADPPATGFVFAQWSFYPDGISIVEGRTHQPEITIITLDEPLIATARYYPIPPKPKDPTDPTP